MQSHVFLGFLPLSNPKVQVEAIEGGALQKLLVILATEQPLTAKKKVGFRSLSPAQPQHTCGAQKAWVPFQAVHITLGGLSGCLLGGVGGEVRWVA